MAKSKKRGPRGVLAGVAGFREAKPSELRAHVVHVRTEVVPKIKDQLKKKESGAERARALKVF